MEINELKDYFDLLVVFASDDIEKGYITYAEMERALKMSGKYCKFLPKYPELKEIIVKLRQEDKDKQILTTVPESHQLGEGEIIIPEQAKKNVERIKNMLKGVC